jgi:hypothetical protein
LATWLIIVGAVFEALGFLAVALDLRDVERESKDLSRKHKRIGVGMAIAEATGLASEGSVTGGPRVTPSLEERVERLEHEVKETSSSLADFKRREKEYHRQILDKAGSWVDDARMETFELVQETRRIIGRAVGGNVWRKRIGLAVFLIGLGVQTAGNAVSL